MKIKYLETKTLSQFELNKIAQHSVEQESVNTKKQKKDIFEKTSILEWPTNELYGLVVQ